MHGISRNGGFSRHLYSIPHLLDFYFRKFYSTYWHMCFNFQVVVEQQQEAEAVLHHPVVHQLPQLKQRLEEHEAERHLQSPLEQQQEVVREEVVQQLPEESQVLCWLSWLGR